MKTIAVISNGKDSFARQFADDFTKADVLRRDIMLDIPDSCLIRSGKPFFIPEFDSEFRACCCLAVKVSRLGKCIAPRFAGRYWAEFSLGVSIHAANTLSVLRREGLPWSGAYVFDRSLIIGDFCSKDKWMAGTSIGLKYGEEEIRIGYDSCDTSAIDEIMSFVSEHNTIRQGDMVLVKMSRENFLLKAPTRLEGFLYERPQEASVTLLRTNIR